MTSDHWAVLVTKTCLSIVQGNSFFSKFARCPVTPADGRWLKRSFQLAFVVAIFYFFFSWGGPAVTHLIPSFILLGVHNFCNLRRPRGWGRGSFYLLGFTFDCIWRPSHHQNDCFSTALMTNTFPLPVGCKEQEKPSPGALRPSG